jgi:branched-chain amino acid transport system permease protein
MEYVYSLLVLVGIYVILSSSFNLIIGHGGLISIAHPIFYALGGYTAGLLGIHFGMPAPLAIACGGLVALVSSVAISLPSLRVSGDYLLITSIGFQLGVLQIIKNLAFTGGPGGLSNIPSSIVGPWRAPIFAAISLGLAAAVVVFIRQLVRGPYGRNIKAMRDDELAFTALGRNAMRIKVAVFALGSGFAGVAGGLYAFYFQYLSPDQFEILQSAMILTMVVVGGMSTTYGPVVGAILLLALPQAITFINLNLPPSAMGGLQGVIFTLLVITFIFVRPQGLVSARGERT